MLGAENVRPLYIKIGCDDGEDGAKWLGFCDNGNEWFCNRGGKLDELGEPPFRRQLRQESSVNKLQYNIYFLI